MVQLKSQQLEALQAVERFLKSDCQVFVLRGYAGTGKTTLISHIIDLAHRCERDVRLTAPTGRAARVLASKTGCAASTIHRAIYVLNEIETDETDLEHLVYYFPLADNEKALTTLTVVDEASMVTCRMVHGEIFRFGTGRLLDDLLTNCRPHHGGKILFVGDPAQLPPIGETKSMALDESFFKNLNLKVDSYTLTDVVRQDSESIILKNAMIIRDVLDSDERACLPLIVDGHELCRMEPPMLAVDLLQRFPYPEINDTAIIVYSNSKALSYNRAVRERLFPGCDTIVPGDLVIVANNKYGVRGEPDFMNGDFLRIVRVGDTVKRSVNLPIEKNGVMSRESISLSFRDVTVRNDDGIEHTCFIIEDLLENQNRNLTVNETKALYIDCILRHHGVKNTSEEFKKILFEDPYYNALRVKYGYSITCHKAQGGEWHTVYADFESRTGLDDDCLRWSYTTMTRAKHCLIAANLPVKGLFSGLSIGPIVRSAAEFQVAQTLPDSPATPFHSIHSSNTLRCKYWSVVHALEQTPYTLIKVESKPWTELYFVESPSGLIRIDAFYNKNEVFTRFIIAKGNANPHAPTVLGIIAQEIEIPAEFHYEPSTSAFEQLYNRMQSICNDSGVQIVAVEEHVTHYRIVYYLKSSENTMRIDFFFDNLHRFTSAQALSPRGDDDAILCEIINRLKN